MAGKSHPKTGAKLTVFSNYEQYGLTWPVGLVRMDVHRHPFRTGLTEVRGCGLQAHSKAQQQCHSVCSCVQASLEQAPGPAGRTILPMMCATKPCWHAQQQSPSMCTL
jgi:hypothetical protein